MIDRRISISFGQPLTPWVRNLMLINAAVYAVQLLTGGAGADNLVVRYLALYPAQVLGNGAVWQLLTYAFLHGGFFHLLFNLFTLWVFGGDVERLLGPRRFLGYYLFSAVGAALFHLIFYPGSMVPVIGASGAIYAVLVAFALFFPDRVITLLLFFVLPVEIKARYLVAIFIAISLFSGISSHGTSDGVAHLAHLGGALTGFLLLRGGPALHSLLFEINKRRQWRQMAARNKRKRQEQARRAQVDQLLDRINEVGYDSLSDAEKASLHKNSNPVKDE